MTKPSKNEMEMLGLINQIQAQLSALDKKLDTLINRSVSTARPPSQPPTERNHERVMYKVICADCQKECTIPFKPSGDRPVYCQDCFSRRKVISMSGIKLEEKAKEPVAVVKKTIKKKKPTPKKK